VRAKDFWVQADAGKPFGKKACVLPRGHGPVQTATTREQILTRLLASGLQVIVDGLAGLIISSNLTG
jgi:hypothetical protein